MPQERLFLFDPKNRDYLKTRSGKPHLGRSASAAMLPMFVIFLLISGFGAMIMNSALNVHMTLAESSAKTTGHITDRRSEYDAVAGSTDYWLDFRYTVGSVFYNGSDLVTEDRFNTAAVGDTVEVTYSPNQPDIALLEWEPMGLFAAIAVEAVVTIIVVTVLLMLLLNIYSRNQLIKHGKVLKGRILKSQLTEDSDKDKWVSLKYEFKSPASGKTLTRSVRRQPIDYPAGGRPTEGDIVAVLYLKDSNLQVL